MSEFDFKNIWTGRIDQGEIPELSLRLHQLIKPLSEADQVGLALVGFCSDEGVRRNQGRVGAAQAPNQTRKFLASIPWTAQQAVYDAGNVVCVDGDLETAHQNLAQQVAQLLDQKHFPFVLGGGHEVAYGSWLGLANHLAARPTKPKIGIINFDAHFDLRTAVNGCNSGTPFYQIAQASHERGWEFKYCCLGVSEMANTQALFQRANELKVSYRLDKQMTLNDLPAIQSQLQTFIDACDHLYLTIDLDVLPAGVAPGVSAPAARGVSLEVIETLIAQIRASQKLRLADLAEYNPVYDQDSHTARVAARLFYSITGGVNP
ncbi:MAG: formimidoylglutamase [Thiothrix sp.]|nr:MAG: formimidoylglutamase [Thiothrix sp.]